MKKTKNILYPEFKLQNYLKSKLSSFQNKKLLYKLRARSVAVKSNFSWKYKDDLRCCCLRHKDTQEELLACELLRLKDGKQDQRDPSDIFSADVLKQAKITEVYEQVMRRREVVTNSMSVTHT